MFEVWLGDVGLILSLSLKFMLIEFEDDPHMSYVEIHQYKSKSLELKIFSK